MSLTTRSKFYYGHLVDSTNLNIEFNDGADKTAVLNVADYSFEEYAVEVARAMNAVSNNNFTCTTDRVNRTLTIAGDSNFTLKIATGGGFSAFTLMGFSGSDLSGSNTYTGSASGSVFIPQFFLQKVVDFEDNQQAISPSVAESANGNIEVVTFGQRKIAQFEIQYQTNNTIASGSVIENQSGGLDNLRTFMEYITKKRKIEVMFDRDTPSTYVKCLCEATPESPQGLNFRLKEYFGRLPGFFQTGVLRFRKVD